MDNQFDTFLKECIEAIGEEYINVPEEMQVPHKFSRPFKKKMRKLMRQKSSNFSILKVPRKRRLSLAVTFTIIILLSLMTAVIGGSRNMIADFFAEVFSTHTVIWNKPDENLNGKITEIYMPTWLPDGYELVKAADRKLCNICVYCNKSDCNHESLDEHIYFIQYAKGKYVGNYDNEHSNMVQIAINNDYGIEFDFEGMYYYVWNNENYTFEFYTHDKFDKKSALDIVHSVQKVESY